jgi:hypothetical protein
MSVAAWGRDAEMDEFGGQGVGLLSDASRLVRTASGDEKR